MIYLGQKLRKLVLSSVLLLVVGLLFVPSFLRQPKAQTEHTIKTRGQTWSDVLIWVCIVPQENQSWWKPEYLNSALNGVDMWNHAIQEFSLKYTEFRYLSKVSLEPAVTSEPVAGFDIYMEWVSDCELEETIGQTKLLVNGSCTIVNSTVCLTAKAPSGHVMTGTDIQNIVVHELGHNFGLSHSNHSEDVMYKVVQYRKTVKPLSTLDLYAVAQNFGWLDNSTQFNSSSSCTELATLTLPSNILYNFFPIAKENMPAVEAQSVLEQLTELLLTPQNIILFSIGTVLVLVVGLVVIRFRKMKGISVNDKRSK